MDSKLPSLSIYWIKYHDIGIRAISEHNYEGTIASIYSMNALLPDDYRLEIDSDKFYRITKEQFKAVCSSCKTECDRIDLKVYPLHLTIIESLIRNAKTSKVWNCAKCGKTNELEKTGFKKLENASPFFYKVIPFPPTRPSGIEGRTNYHQKMVPWFYHALEELDHQLGLLRVEYEAMDNRDDVMDIEENVQY